jgi:hypothetical protein
MLIMTFIFGLVRQNGATDGFLGNIGFRSMSTSWPFCLLLLYFITVLGMRAMEEVRNWKSYPILPTVIHTVIFIVLAAAFFGSGDKEKIRIVAEKGNPTYTGVSLQTGRLAALPFVMTLEEFTIVMEQGEPKMFISRVKIEDRKGEKTADIKVNHPARVGTWRIYQMGYEKDKCISTLECVKDGWYPIIKTGLWIILVAGVSMALTAGYKRKRE